MTPAAFNRFVDVVAGDGWIMPMHCIEGYFDESERKSGAFTVAGCLFEAKQAKKFNKEWRGLFGDKLPFHMVDLAALQGTFKGLPRGEADAMLREAIAIMNRRVYLGVVVCCRLKDFEEVVGTEHGDVMGHCYSFCAHFCMGVAAYRLRTTGDQRKVAYFFESGHQYQAEAHRLFDRTVAFPRFTSTYQYASHAFIPKDSATPLQAADLLAWESLKAYDESILSAVRRPRKSLLALISPVPDRYRILDFNRALLERFSTTWRSKASTATAAEAWEELHRVGDPSQRTRLA